MDDQDRKLPQRLAIYLGMERYDLAAGLAPLLMALPEVEDITRYQLVYACFMVGDQETVSRLVEGITDPSLRSSAGELL